MGNPVRLDFEWVMPMMRYNTSWRKSRGAFHRALGSQSSVEPYYEVQQEEIKRHLIRLLENPEDFSNLGRKYVSRCTLLGIAVPSRSC